MIRNFLAEIKKVESKKLVSNDMEAALTIITNDMSVLDLGKLPGETIVKVTIEVMKRQFRYQTIPEPEEDKEIAALADQFVEGLENTEGESQPSEPAMSDPVSEAMPV